MTIEITTRYDFFPDGNGNIMSFFNMQMKRDEILANTSIVVDCLDDPENSLEALKVMLESLYNHLYPELKDPLYKLKKRLLQVEREKNHLEKEIGILQTIRGV